MPAQSDPRFADRPPGYLTTSPGWRDDIFYYEPGTDPRVVSVDEATKETGTSGELATYDQHGHPDRRGVREGRLLKLRR